MSSHAPIWTLSTPQVYETLSTSVQGLSEAETAVREHPIFYSIERDKAFVLVCQQ
jgi:hypothetical protein